MDQSNPLVKFLGCTTQQNPPVYYNRAAADRDGMAYLRLGSTGVVVSRLCLGMMGYGAPPPGGKPWLIEWILSPEEGEKFVRQALDLGINFFDTAEVYSEGRSEECLGAALKKLLPSSRFTREDLVISTKMLPARGLPGGSFAGLQRWHSRKAVFDAVEGSLRRLQMDYIAPLEIGGKGRQCRFCMALRQYYCITLRM